MHVNVEMPTFKLVKVRMLCDTAKLRASFHSHREDRLRRRLVIRRAPRDLVLRRELFSPEDLLRAPILLRLLRFLAYLKPPWRQRVGLDPIM